MASHRVSPGCRQPGFSRHRVGCGGAFTLIELLIVVAIIAILAAIAVPNFLEAQTRAKVSRVKSDARSLATAVESYRIDWNRYAPRTKIPVGSGVFGLGDVRVRCEGDELGCYTSPVSYMSSLPVDVFERKIPAPNNLLEIYPPNLVQHMRSSHLGSTFPYDKFDTASGYRYGFVIFSVGPDGYFGSPQAPATQGFYPPVPPPGATSWFHEYDATNGTISEGNVNRFSSGVNADEVFRGPF